MWASAHNQVEMIKAHLAKGADIKVGAVVCLFVAPDARVCCSNVHWCFLHRCS
jgi:hypothetical protein